MQTQIFWQILQWSRGKAGGLGEGKQYKKTISPKNKVFNKEVFNKKNWGS